ncbi:MAG: LPS export ABC transporter periplasmic protein LptC [Omnitrophica WOR_2 bacterium GWC2_45_7]|nr:MAG: LPS export ABC transporter periplasmic protein LptC [Omnitrophica WOR_2 bacterium GWA2_45_18]OGX21108.1 MAG: LPS export ABC transporter periplasmic protein LptC [Omnitrophica WOR_2 bacterium GWC2_45_7]
MRNIFWYSMRIGVLTGVLAAVGAVSVHAADDELQQKFQGFNLQGYADNGDKAWDVKGDTADVKGSEIEITNVVANSYGEQKVNVTAEKGVIDQASGNMQLNKDVVITSEQGAQILTDSLQWSRNDDLVTTEDNVTITDDNFSVRGKGMEARPGLKNAKIHEDVTVMVDTEPEKELNKILTITSDGPMVMDQAKGFAMFQDNVVAVQEDQTLKADKMEIFFDLENNKIKELVCSGHVMVEKGENRTYAEKAVYNAVNQKITLSGRPKLIMLTEGKDAITSLGN